MIYYGLIKYKGKFYRMLESNYLKYYKEYKIHTISVSKNKYYDKNNELKPKFWALPRLYIDDFGIHVE